MCAQLLSHVQLFATPWTVACQAPLSMEFPRQEYWGGLPFSTPGDLDAGQGSNPCVLRVLHWLGRFFTVVPPEKSSRRVIYRN